MRAEVWGEPADFCGSILPRSQWKEEEEAVSEKQLAKGREVILMGLGLCTWECIFDSFAANGLVAGKPATPQPRFHKANSCVFIQWIQWCL